VTQNPDNSTYHSLNVQFTQRLTRGFTNTTTYIWSKAMGPGGAIDPFHQNTKQLQAVDHKGQISSNGTYELPFGANHYVAGNAPGWVQGIVNNMQVSGIMNYTTGSPISITGISTIAGGTGNPVIVGNLEQNLGGGKISETSTGVTYFEGWTTIQDPGLSLVSPVCTATPPVTVPPTPAPCNGMSAGYNNRALQDPSGNIVLVNAQPGQAGNLGAMTVRGPGRFDLDMNVVKRIKVAESKSVELRVDVVNVMNHPNFSNPALSINSNGNFGRITSLASGQNIGGNGGMRSFVINTRFNF
jgi:hypothetical protein